ncbi:acyl-CoA transferase [Erwinia persicina]|uniref:CoA transferase n=1 Tax=Erwinia persicina TaxID=55211 RepID=UPI000E4EAA36|nr:CoA transferase [Erwinia persicina]AXU94866.1 acyl-CoA transferase [Erwinia persicina]MBC3943700.1 CoA transferase [Erwinia persicina]MCQ4107480.1 CoA transferase [Erwinia persicina]QZQ51908.1 CoA transferase [Erwinia persicina]UTX14663.1 CoA transferase [Erwinia persicina]
MDHRLSTALWQQLWHGLRNSSTPLPELRITGEQALVSAYPVSELAATSFALAAQATASLTGAAATVTVDGTLASRWFQQVLRPVNRPTPPLWDAFAGDYATADGWLRLHTNAPHHRAAMEQVLGRHASRQQLAAAVAAWRKSDLEQAVVDAGGCAAALRSHSEWQQHPQGQSVSRESLIEQTLQACGPMPAWRLPAARPLLGVRVLDLTRIIAGPVATRFLAGLGAEVLRIDPPGWQEPSLEEEITPGKRCARLDLKTAGGRQQFEQLLSQSDVLVHGYRADALSQLGYDSESLQQHKPGLVEVSLNAWGWTGPWRNRRGFDSLVQMACGIAERGRLWQGSDAPVPLPVQALDHATGYMMAAAVLEGLRQRLLHGTGFTARLSLARTACLLTDAPYPQDAQPAGLGPRRPQDDDPEALISPWGISYRLRSPFWLPGTPLAWSRAPSPFGSAPPVWR